jgi:hypothetical protein
MAEVDYGEIDKGKEEKSDHPVLIGSVVDHYDTL